MFPRVAPLLGSLFRVGLVLFALGAPTTLLPIVSLSLDAGARGPCFGGLRLPLFPWLRQRHPSRYQHGRLPSCLLFGVALATREGGVVLTRRFRRRLLAVCPLLQGVRSQYWSVSVGTQLLQLLVASDVCMGVCVYVYAGRVPPTAPPRSHEALATPRKPPMPTKGCQGHRRRRGGGLGSKAWMAASSW